MSEKNSPVEKYTADFIPWWNCQAHLQVNSSVPLFRELALKFESKYFNKINTCKFAYFCFETPSR